MSFVRGQSCIFRAMKNSAILALVLCALLAGSNGVMIKQMTSLTPGAIAWFRALVPLVILLPIVLRSTRDFWGASWKKMLLASGVNAGRMYLFLIAFTFTSIGNAIVIFYLWPIFVNLIGSFFLKEKVSRKQVFLLLLAFSGLVLTYADKSFSFGDRDFIGMLAAFFSALGYAITVVIFKSESENYERNHIIVFQNLLGVLVFLPFLTVVPKAEITHIGLALFYGLIIGVVAFKLFFYGLNKLTASLSASLMYLEVASALCFGLFLLQEKLTFFTLCGGAMIVVSSFFISQLKSESIELE